ncbi:MAG: extracellular solute-binding protein [Clostridia bacterium]|nr:extracellular solute-binding protein [Clostridia bacterium]
MKSLKKLCAALCFILALVMLASCGNAGVKADTTAGGVTTAEAGSDIASVDDETTGIEFPSANFGGDSFTAYIRINTYYSGDYVDAEEENGDLMNDTVFRRNSIVEEKYNIVIDTKSAPSPHQTLDKDIAGGAADYDLILDRRADLATTSVSGLLYDFNSVDIDYTRPWWDNNAQGYAIKGRLFLMANDVDTGVISGARFLYFNRSMIESFHLDDPYDLVANNDWTLENFLTLVKGAHEDKGTGEIGIYGLLRETGSSNGNHMHLLVGCGVRSTETTSDGEIVQAIGDKTEKIADIFDQLRPVLTDTSLVMTYDEVNERFTEGSYSSKWYRGRGAFAAGHFLFIQNGLDVSVEIADMTDKYGVAPNPKYNRDQENYYHKVDRYAAIWGIPNTPADIDLDRLAKVFDYWAYVSSETVMPAYYDVTIKTRRFSDPVASDMIDIVKGSLVYDAGDVYGLNVLSTLDTAFTSGSVAASLNPAYIKSIGVSIKNIVSTIESKYGG